MQNEGLRRLRRLLRVIVLHCHEAGKAAILAELLTDAASKCANADEARDQHWQRFNKRGSNSVVRGKTGMWKRIRAARRAKERGEQPPLLYGQTSCLPKRRRV
jgi:hypothetical protein